MSDKRDGESVTLEQGTVNDGPKKPDKFFGIRHIQSILLFCLLVVAFGMRVTMSVAVVAMTDAASSNPDFEEYDWSVSTQSVVLSSFFWGYITTQIPAGMMARRFGPKILLTIAIGICSLMTLLTPVSASSGGWGAVCALRVIQGITQGFIYPCCHTLLARWVPPSERARLATFVYAGGPLGNVIILAVSGLLAASSIGWPGIFYLSGGIGALWTVTYFIFGSNSPEENKQISQAEKAYIQESLGQKTDVELIKKVSTPWKSIMTSMPFISLIVVHCAQNWGFWTLLTEIPSYMKNVLEMDIKKNALLSALPYLTMWILSFVMSPISDYIMNKGYLSTGNTRKLFNSLGHYIPMMALIGLGYVTEDYQAVILLTIAVGMNIGTFVGFQVNHMDLSPVHAGTLMGITNFAANIMSILGPLFVGLILDDETDPVEWRTVFFVAAGVYLVGNTFFIIFGRGTVQSWNEPEDEDTNVGKSTETALSNITDKSK